MALDDAAVFRIKRVEGTPETVELGQQFFRDVVTGCCNAVPGFRGAWFLVDREHHRTVTLTAWADVECLNTAVRGLAAHVQRDPDAAAIVDRINAGRVAFETYEVALPAPESDRR